MPGLSLAALRGPCRLRGPGETGVAQLRDTSHDQAGTRAGAPDPDLVETFGVSGRPRLGPSARRTRTRVRVPVAVIEVAAQGVEEPWRDRHDAPCPPLPSAMNRRPSTPTDVLETEAEDFATAQPGEQHRVDYRSVPILAECRDEFDDVVVIEDLWQVPDRSHERITRRSRVTGARTGMPRWTVVVSSPSADRCEENPPPSATGAGSSTTPAVRTVDRDHRRVGRAGRWTRMNSSTYGVGRRAGRRR